jgi:hypothetical protein
MRANKQRIDSDDTSIDGFVTLLNDFAVLPEQALSQRARSEDGVRRARHAPSSTPRTAPTLSRPRASFAGFLAILLVGGLGFTIWSEPHGCLGCDDALMVAPSAQASDTTNTPSRFQYTANLGEILKQEPSHWALSLDQASKTAEVRGEEPSSQPMPKFAAAQIDASGAPSPMTTSATGRLYQPRSLTEARPPQHNGRLPTVVVEVSDAKPKPVTLAAANEISEEIASLPSVLAVEHSSLNDVAAIDIPIRKPEASGSTRRQMRSQRPRRTARPRKKIKAAQGNNVPGWAKKMFDGNWQGRAFSYQDR